MHFAATQFRIRSKDRHYHKIKKDLTEEEQMAHDALVSFELFDSDGSGRIDEYELADMLEQLAIPMDPEGVKGLADEIDTDGGGDIDFGEFLDWYVNMRIAVGSFVCLGLWLYLCYVVAIFHIEWCIRTPYSSSIILYDNISIAQHRSKPDP